MSSLTQAFQRRELPPVVTPIIPVLGLALVMWVQELVDSLPGVDLDQYGIRPRDSEGLLGIPAAPFLHGGFDHLIANTGPFLILGALVAFTARTFWAVTFGVMVLGGLGTWLVGEPHSVHIGASGLVYGYAAFLVAWGVLTRNLLSALVAIAVVLMYGGIIIGVLPGQPGISWQGHAFGAAAGIGMAVFLRGRDMRRRAAGQVAAL